MENHEEDIFSPEEIQDEEPYSPEYHLSEREVYTTPADPDVETILKRIQEKNLILRPEFQRANVWDVTRKSRLIESLLLNLPIPPCFLAEDADGTRVVVDGQQRLIAIDDFFHGRYALKGLQVLKDLNNLKWSELPPRLDRKILQRVVRTLVISNQSNPGIKFEIFERLNTGGEPLTEQEIRNATLRGALNNLLNDVASSQSFLAAIGVAKPDVRLRHHELVLRFFAVRDSLADYKPPLKMILTEYMRRNREANAEESNRLKMLFQDSLEKCRIVFGDNPFRRFRARNEENPQYESTTSKAVFELQMISLSYADREATRKNHERIELAFQELSVANAEFSESLSRATDHRSRFYQRMKLWESALNKISGSNELTGILKQVKD